MAYMNSKKPETAFGSYYNSLNQNDQINLNRFANPPQVNKPQMSKIQKPLYKSTSFDFDPQSMKFNNNKDFFDLNAYNNASTSYPAPQTNWDNVEVVPQLTPQQSAFADKYDLSYGDAAGLDFTNSSSMAKQMVDSGQFNPMDIAGKSDAQLGQMVNQQAALDNYLNSGPGWMDYGKFGLDAAGGVMDIIGGIKQWDVYDKQIEGLDEQIKNSQYARATHDKFKKQNKSAFDTVYN